MAFLLYFQSPKKFPIGKLLSQSSNASNRANENRFLQKIFTETATAKLFTSVYITSNRIGSITLWNVLPYKEVVPNFVRWHLYFRTDANYSETYFEPCQASKMDPFMKMIKLVANFYMTYIHIGAIILILFFGLKYCISSNKRPRRLLNFETERCGSY